MSKVQQNAAEVVRAQEAGDAEVEKQVAQWRATLDRRGPRLDVLMEAGQAEEAIAPATLVAN